MSEVVDRVRHLRRERKFADALDAIDAATLDDPPQYTAAALFAERALIHVEYGHHDDAQADYDEAFQRDRNPWHGAEALVQGVHAARTVANETIAEIRPGGTDEHIKNAVESCEEAYRDARVDAEAEIDDALESAGDDADRAAAQLWARAAIRVGFGPDARTDRTAREAAIEAIDEARRLSPGAWRPLIAGLRLARSEARVADADETPDALAAARRRIEAARGHASADEHPWWLSAALDYERGRIELGAWKWAEARKYLCRAIDADAGHQAANVWLVYCDRMLGKPPDELVTRIDGLLRDGGREQPPCVIEPTLVAELRTERAALIEGKRVTDATRDYRAALAVRPAMWFARRGVIRCLDQVGRTDDALAEGDLALALAEELDPQPEPPAALLVELARVHADAGRMGKAIEYFERVEGGSENYPFAYQAHVAALRRARRDVEALEVGTDAMNELGASAVGMGGVRMEVGYTHLQDRDYDKAMQAFSDALADADSEEAHRRARLGIVTTHRLRGRLRHAMDELAGVTAPSSARVSLVTGWLRADIGDYGGSLRCFEVAYAQWPRDLLVMTSRARAMRQLGRPRSALSFLESRLPDVPEKRRAPILNEAAWTQLDLGDARGARDRFELALKDPPAFEPALRGLMAAEWRIRPSTSVLEAGIARAEGALNLLPPFELAGIHNEAGLCCVRAGDLPAARVYFERALEKVGPGRTEFADVLLLMQANALLAADALADAEARVARVRDRALPLRDDPRCTLIRARCRAAAGDPEGALALYKRVDEQWKKCGHAIVGMASAYFARREYGRSAEMLTRLDTAGAPARELLAWTFVKRHEDGEEAGPGQPAYLDRATVLCEEVLELEPSHAGAYECLGTIALLRSQFAAADAYTRQAVAANPARAEAHRNRAAVHLRLARYDDAVACLETALGCRGPHSVTNLLLGFACSQSGRDTDAVQHLRRAIALDAHDPLAPDLLASVLERGGDYPGADEVLTRALMSVPRRRAARTRLGRARVLCAQASDKAANANALLDEALREADHGLTIARELPMGCRERAETESAAHYHRGVVLHRRGRPQRAREAFKAAEKGGDTFGAAERALALLGDDVGQGDAGDRRVRAWGNALAWLGLLLGGGAIALEFATQDWSKPFRFFPVSYIVAGALLVVILGAALPRLAGLSLGGQVEIRISEPRAVEPVAVTLAFERSDSLPATMMAGPGAMPSGEIPYDNVGDPG